MFKKGQLVRAILSGRYFKVIGVTRNYGRWRLQELRTGKAYTANSIAAMSFTLIGNNYKAKG